MSPTGLLQPIPLPDKIWEEVSMDFIERLPKSDTFDTILVVVDRLSKYGHFIALKHPFTAQIVAQVVRLHSILESIIADLDKVFLSHFWFELFRLQGLS